MEPNAGIFPNHFEASILIFLLILARRHYNAMIEDEEALALKMEE